MLYWHNEMETANRARLAAYKATENPAEYETEVAELKTLVRKAKAVADTFADRYTEADTRGNLEAVTRDPETFTYLFSVLEDILWEAVQRGERLDA